MISWMEQNQTTTLIVVGVVVLFVLASHIKRRLPKQKDPQRMFSRSQKREGDSRAGWRCEMESFPFIRCRGTSEHGDHWYPWSLGGVTDMGNYVSACAKCNLKKSAKVPTKFQTARLEHRRKKYFPAGVPVKAGERYRR